MKKVLILLFVLFSYLSIYSQVNLNIILRTPTPSSLSEWQTDPSIVQIVITNQSTQSYPNSYISFSIINEQNVVVAETDDYDQSIPRFNIPAGPSTVIFNGPQVVNVNTVSFDPTIRNIAITTNSIPEGNYQFCVRLLDQSGNNISATGEICTNFFVMIPDPPTLISPVDNEIISSPFPNFIWTPVTNVPPGLIIKYKLKICPIFEGQTPRTAIESNPVLLERDNIQTTSYIYLPSDLPFNYFPNTIGFVWMVQAFNQYGLPATRNEGKSELGTFRVSGETSSLNLAAVYPSNNDTLPWNPPFLIAKFYPYSDDIRTVRFTLRFKKEGSSTEQTLIRQLNFPSGPMTSQGLSSQEKASLLFVNVDNTNNIISWMRNLEEGKKYLWTVDAEFVKSSGEVINASTGQSSFVYGLRKLQQKTPANDSSITSGRNFNIAWQIPQPEQLNFNLLDVLQQSGFHAYGSSTNAKAKFKVELSRQSSFDSIYSSKVFQIPYSGEYNTGSNCDSLFMQISKQYSINDTGVFYWRVKYLSSTDEAYYTSESRTFRITPVTVISCFEMNVQIPQNYATISSTKPKFSVSVKPRIRKSAITGGRIRIWTMQSKSEQPSDVKSRTPVLDTTFAGNDDKKLFAYSTDMGGYTRYDLNFINTDSSSVTFNADTNKHYLWNFTLNFNKDSIRADGIICDTNLVVSNDGIFSVTSEIASDSNTCAGDCIVSAPTNTTISTATFAQDTVIKIGQFNLKLKTVSGNGASLSGEGEIEIPFLRAPILVEFNGLKINTDNQVFDGEVYAKIVDNAPYSAPEGNDFEGQALSFASDKLKFKAIHEYSASAGRLVSGLAGGSAVGLPIGFDRDYDGYKVVIGIIGMKFTPTQAMLNAAMYVEIPDLGPDVGFGLGAKNICFHKDGISGISRAKLYLAQDFGYRNEGTWSILFKAPTPSDPGTYATWDCEGFKDLFISAEVEFPRSWLKPSPDTDSTKLVKAHFNTRAEKRGNGWQWMASANLDQCEITSAPGFKLLVQDMVFDYSTSRNPETISFPSGYTGNTTNEWKGFFIRRASFILPDKLKTFENENPSLTVDNLIIDRTGFTANIVAANIIQYPRGNFGDWGASLDSIKFRFVSSSLQLGYMRGRIKVSIFDSSLVYTGTVAHLVDSTKLSYQFLIQPPDTINTSWDIKLSLYPSSRIELTDTSGSFFAQAILSGSMTLQGDLGSISKIGFSGITFQNWGIKSTSPHFIKGTYSFASPQHSLSGFPVTISDIDIVTGTRGGRFAGGVKFTIGVNLQPGSNAISGNTTLSVWAKMGSDTGPQHFVFDGVELEGISINADLGAVKIIGSVNLYNAHSVYGNGFRGAVDAVFVNQFAVSATAQFGSVNNYRYWYVDAKALMPTGIPIFSGVGIYGFGGGAWYHMRKSGETSLSTTPPPTDTSLVPGRTNSGFTYTPDNNINFGFRATIILGTHPSPDAFNGDVSLEAEFLSGGGISRVSILGNGYMLCSITNRSSAKVRADVNMEYNFPNRTFHGVFNVNINATPFTGSGQMVLHFAPDVWFIKIGEPSNKITVKLANWLQVGGYFMVGMNLPAPPPLPSEIQSLFPTFSTQPRNPAIQQGNGFAFGASVDINTGRKTFLIFYGQARFMGGFDMALLNYGPGTTCEGSSGTIGVNGWYAMGQIYVYASASIGLHVDLWFVDGDFEILNIAAGAALQGAGPNPTWIKGVIGGRYRILGGAIKGTCNFEFKLGTECIPVVENPLARIDLISDVNPASGSTNVDVFTEPQVALNFEANTPFELEEMPTSPSQPARVRTFRIKLNPVTLRRSSDNQSIPSNLVISQDKYSAYLSPFDVLGANTQYKFRAVAYGEELISGVWQSARRNDGSVIQQSVETNFTTGAAPDYIPQSNVAYTYPLNGNKYFLQDECRNGVVQLITGQPNLFIPREGYTLELTARFIPLDFNLQPIDVPFTYNNASRTISFTIPQLLNNKAYFVQIVKKEVPQQTIPGGTGGIQPINWQQLQNIGSQLTVRENLIFNNPMANVFLTKRTISASRVKFGEKLLYVFYFKTSQFNTLQSKLATLNYLLTEPPQSSGNYEYQKAKYSASESFDYFDFKPYQWVRSGNTYYIGPLIRVTADERTAPWHIYFTNPLIYDKIQWLKNKGWWNYDNMFDLSRFGFSDIKLVEVENPASPPTITDVTQMIYSGTVTTGSGTTGGGLYLYNISNMLQLQSGFFQVIVPPIVIKYNHGMIVPLDYFNLRYRVISLLSNWFFVTLLSNDEKANLLSIKNTTYQKMFRGNYPLRFSYNYWGCHGPDDPIPTYFKWFVY